MKRGGRCPEHCVSLAIYDFLSGGACSQTCNSLYLNTKRSMRLGGWASKMLSCLRFNYRSLLLDHRLTSSPTFYHPFNNLNYLQCERILYRRNSIVGIASNLFEPVKISLPFFSRSCCCLYLQPAVSSIVSGDYFGEMWPNFCEY